MKIEVMFEPREDGGLRAYCPSVPGFVLSHSKPDLVMADVEPVLEVILSEMLGMQVMVRRMVDVDVALGKKDELPPAYICHKEYVGTTNNR